MEFYHNSEDVVVREPPVKRMKLNGMPAKASAKLGPMPEGEKTLQKRKRYLA